MTIQMLSKSGEGVRRWLIFIVASLFLCAVLWLWSHSVVLLFGWFYDPWSDMKNDRRITTEDYFHPIGASNVLAEASYSIDSIDAYWTFDISEPDFTALADAISKRHSGPKTLRFRKDVAYPAAWDRPDRPPDWWPPGAGGNVQSISWCASAN